MLIHTYAHTYMYPYMQILRGAKMPQLFALTDKLKRGHQLERKSAEKAAAEAEEIEISANERSVASSVAKETPMDVGELTKPPTSTISISTSTETYGSEDVNHDADIASIEKATAKAVGEETPTHPDGEVIVPTLQRIKPLDLIKQK